MFTIFKKKSRWEKIEPQKSIYYPDRHGYTGYSICTWNIPKKMENDWGRVLLNNEWGGFSPERVLSAGVYRPFVLEGRFFVFGSLLCLCVVTGDISKKLDEQWRPVTDKIESRYYATLERNKTKQGSSVHIDEVVDAEIARMLKSNLYLNRSEYFKNKGWL